MSTLPSTSVDPARADDEENLALVRNDAQVDRLNGDFYNRYPYPWAPQTFDFITDPDLYRLLLNQNIGDWTHSAIPRRPRIWVAGCGTNQAVYVALRHPDADIVGSDLSAASLDICRRTAESVGVSHLTLRQETINDAAYDGEFDLVICTGVIHHNADPARALRRLRSAMKPSGLLELMVYNRFQRSVHSAFQKALRLLIRTDDTPAHRSRELAAARRLAETFPARNRVSELLAAFRAAPEAALADALIQPVEHSYTVESLVRLAGACGLDILCPTLNEWDTLAQSRDWHIALGNPELQAAYDSLPDLRRWQITNLLLMEQSPQLWFYLTRTDAPRPRRSMADVNASFLDVVFTRVASSRGYYRRSAGGYRRASTLTPFPTAAPAADVAAILPAVDGRRPIRDILRSLGWPSEFGSLLKYRLGLATTAFPYLVATASDRS